MKEIDCKKICEVIEKQFQSESYELNYLIGDTLAEMVVLNIYLTNDWLKAHGQDLKDFSLSVISTRYRLSIIAGDKMSWGKLDVPICGYKDLEEDIKAICMMIQYVLDRLSD